MTTPESSENRETVGSGISGPTGHDLGVGTTPETAESVAAYTLVQNDEGDWIGLYGADGRLIYEGHSISEAEMLRLVGIAHDLVWDVDLSDLGRLPASLGEVAALGGMTKEVRP